MKWKKYLPYPAFILITLAAGGLSSIAVTKGIAVYEQLAKPPLTPPGAVFPVAWTILYVLMGIGAAMVWTSSAKNRSAAMVLYAVQLALNLLWSVWFFGFHAHLFAFIWLLFLVLFIVLMIRSYSRISRAAAWLQIPYLLWCCFAAYLNFGVWLLNR